MPKSGPSIEMTVKPYETAWNATLFWRAFVASPTCMAVKTKAMYTVADASQDKLSCKKPPYWFQGAI